VFLDVSQIHPLERLHESDDVSASERRTKWTQGSLQVVQRWDEISHKRHKKEWDLEHVFLNEADAIAQISGPRSRLEVDEPRKTPKEYPDPQDLLNVS
jgi:hypothetical protein